MHCYCTACHSLRATPGTAHTVLQSSLPMCSTPPCTRINMSLFCTLIPACCAHRHASRMMNVNVCPASVKLLKDLASEHTSCTPGSHPIGGIACVGMRSLSFANIAESDKSPLALLMSATCTKHRTKLVKCRLGIAQLAYISVVAVSRWPGTYRDSVSDCQACHSIQLCHLQHGVIC